MNHKGAYCERCIKKTEIKLICREGIGENAMSEWKKNKKCEI